jgi:hypothetical protein
MRVRTRACAVFVNSFRALGGNRRYIPETVIGRAATRASRIRAIQSIIRGRAMTGQAPSTRTEAPAVDAITPYDEAHFEIYVRILDASVAGASLGDIAATILGIDPKIEPERAIRTAQSHLRRARWMATHGYRHLLRS